MNAEQRKNIEKKIKEINDAIITQMAAEEKNSYDPEVTLPQNIEKTDITIKKAYDLQNREADERNKKRRENRQSTLETYIIKNRHKQAEEYIRKQHYTTVTSIAQKANIANERTGRKIIKELFTMIGYNAEKIPKAVTGDVEEIVKKWLPHTKTLYGYNREKIRPLDMTEEEMTCVYETYILTKKIILINSANKKAYDQSIEKLNRELTPIYAAIRALNSIT